MAEHNQSVDKQLSLISDGQSGPSSNAGSTQRLLDACKGVPVRVADVSRSGLPEISLDSSRAQRSASNSPCSGSPCSASSFRGSFRGPLSSVISTIVDKFKSFLNLDGGREDDEGDDDGEEKSRPVRDDDEGTGSCGPRGRSRVRGDMGGANTYLANAMSQVHGLGLALSILKNASESAKSGGCCNNDNNARSSKKSAARAEGLRGRYGSTANKMIMGMPGYDMHLGSGR
jgi:hypothetical protein